MNGLKRLFKLLRISDKELFVLSGDIDTYVYLLFLRNCVYFMTILGIIDCSILIPLYGTGDIAASCNNPQTNSIVLTQI
jgi:hypothetical protein